MFFSRQQTLGRCCLGRVNFLLLGFHGKVVVTNASCYSALSLLGRFPTDRAACPLSRLCGWMPDIFPPAPSCNADGHSQRFGSYRDHPPWARDLDWSAFNQIISPTVVPGSPKWLCQERCWIAPKTCWIAPKRCWIALKRSWIALKRSWITPKRCWIAPKRCWIDPKRCWIAPKRCLPSFFPFYKQHSRYTVK